MTNHRMSRDFFLFAIVVFLAIAVITLTPPTATFAQGRTRPKVEAEKPASPSEAATDAEAKPEKAAEKTDEIKDELNTAYADLKSVRADLKSVKDSKDLLVVQNQGLKDAYDAIFSSRRFYVQVGVCIIAVLLVVTAVFALLKWPKIRNFMISGIMVVLFVGLVLLAWPSLLGAATPIKTPDSAKTTASAKTSPAPKVQKMICGDVQYNANFFTPDGKDQNVICTGVRGKTLEFDDPRLAISDLKSTPAGFTFTLNVAKGAVLGFPDTKVDGKVVESTLEIVDETTYVERDRTISSILQVLHKSAGGSSDEVLFRSYLLGLSQQYGLDNKKILSMLQSSKPGTSKESVSLIESARQKRTVDVALSDPRLQKAMSDALTSFSNNLPQPTSDQEIRKIAGEEAEKLVAPVRERVARVESNQSAQAARLVMIRNIMVERGTRGEKKALREIPDWDNPQTNATGRVGMVSVPTTTPSPRLSGHRPMQPVAPPREEE